jgi:hypothetical protein
MIDVIVRNPAMEIDAKRTRGSSAIRSATAL